MGSSASLDDLPPEMISELFKHLHPKDLVVCSMVNKRWHSIYAGFRLDKLVVIENFKSYKFGRWCYPDRRIEDKLCAPKMFIRLADQPLLSKLKHLALCEKRIKFDADDLNRFNQLVHLEIFGDLGGEKVNLNLPKLKIIEIHAFNIGSPLLIDCPELSMLVYRGEPADRSLLDVKHPKTIRMLDTNMIGSKLVRFKSVECLVTREFEVISRDSLLSLPRLKELRYNKNISYHLHHSEVGTTEKMKRTLREFLDDVKVLKGSDLKFTFAGFQLTGTTLDEIDFGVQTKEGRNGREYEEVSEHVYLQNYRLIDPDATLDFINDLNYSCLMRIMAGEIPGGFFRQFPQIESVEAKDVQDEAHFLRFLKSLKSLKSLHLFDLHLSQEFYDQLPASANALIKLEFGGDYELQLNFAFIGKLSGLSNLSIYPEVFAESLPSLIRSLGELERGYFNFSWKDDMVSIKKRKTVYKFRDFDGRTFKTKNPKKILKFLRKA